ncbi:NRPS-like enzyme [Aspergillus ellipticus CBS 707.79]|uniref:NRPS-like enzyme n=1 Tax=Aspergillus ellipticus CBS 707.79 TaxID=1448320 RepID=A0A319DDU2_9EURO|nr:NRPS-like enzyme [Aspergillus ellipticus CBS 707.79]
MDFHFSQHAALNPTGIAIDNGDQQWSYSDLDREVGRLASLLKSLQLPPQDPVCILEGVGTGTIVAQLAVIRAGLTCVPIEPSIPTIRLMNLLRNIGARYILSDQTPDVDDDVIIIPISEEYFPRDALKRTQTNDPPQHVPCRDPSEYRSHILYTSGSSGKPKAVQIAEISILHLAFETPLTPLNPSDRVAVINNPGFDISLFEVFVPLMAGSTLVIVPRSTIIDPFGARDFIAKKAISIIFLTSSLFSVIAQACPTAFSGVRHVLTAGEVANMPSARAVLDSWAPPDHLWNTYGPTEATTFSTIHLVTPEEFQYDNISIGKPFGDTKLRLVDESFNDINQPGKIGEILLGGPGLTPGYINRPGENEDRFLVDQDGLRLYRTGDFARWRPEAPDLLVFTGRTDLQVKQGGFRVELEEIEQLFLSSGRLLSAIVAQIQPDAEDDEPFLVAFLIPAVASTVCTRQMIEFIEARVPAYAVPRDIVFCPDYPFTDHGKVDRKALAKKYSNERGKWTHADPMDASLPDTGTIVRGIWTSLLGQSDIKDTDDFFTTLRGSSLQAAALISKVRKQLGKTIAMRSLYENSHLKDLVNHIDQFAEGGNAPDEGASWLSDADIAVDLHSVPDWQAADEGRIFLTGATGFVGAHFLSRLLQMPTVQEVVCLTRGKAGVASSERVQAVLKRYNLWANSSTHLHKLTVLNGDITTDHLGLTPKAFTWLVNWASIVFHLAAKVNFCEPYDAHYRANVLGTRHAMEVAARGRRKAFIHMSSIDTWGPTGLVFGTRKLMEDGPLEPHLRGLPFDIGYAASKWVSEMMVRRAREQGLATMIFRPGFIVGDSHSGCGNPDDFFARLVVGSIQLGAFPHLPNQRMEYVTVDYVCDATLHISSNDQNLGKSYSLVAPDPADSMNLEITHQAINRAGYPVDLVPYWDWVHMLQDVANRDNPLMPVMPLLQEPVLGKLSRFETSRNTPHYDSSNTLAALKDAPEIGYIPFDVGMLTRFMDFWNEKGFYCV